MKWIEMISIALWFRAGSKSSILPVVFQTINWLSTWIVESDAGTYSHRFHQELIIQRLAVSHATTPTAHLFYSSFLPRFTLWPMGRREKNLEKTHKNTPKRKAKVPCQQWHQHTSKWKSTRTSTTKCPNLGEIKRTKSQCRSWLQLVILVWVLVWVWKQTEMWKRMLPIYL